MGAVPTEKMSKKGHQWQRKALCIMMAKAKQTTKTIQIEIRSPERTGQLIQSRILSHQSNQPNLEPYKPHTDTDTWYRYLQNDTNTCDS
ncbi:MAG: hypothetical protein GY820_14475 [Gammaproteobacteria bacterium]|nr:hypothetical protein [Gammaproteobacteria bacterium]